MNIGPILWVLVLIIGSICIGRDPKTPFHYAITFDAWAQLLHPLWLKGLGLFVVCGFLFYKTAANLLHYWRSRRNKAKPVISARVQRLDEDGNPTGEWIDIPGITNIETSPR